MRGYKGAHCEGILKHVTHIIKIVNINTIPVGKISEKALCRSVFLTTLHCILSAELTKNVLLQTDFAHWDINYFVIMAFHFLFLKRRF